MGTVFLLSVLYDGIFAAIAAIGFSLISNPPKRVVAIAAGLAAIGHASRFFMIEQTPLGLTGATLFAAFMIGMLSMFAAKQVRCPAEIFAFPSLLPMVPGMYAYNTVLHLMEFMSSDNDPARIELIINIAFNGFTAFSVTSAMVIGASIPLFIFHEQSYMMTRAKRT